MTEGLGDVLQDLHKVLERLDETLKAPNPRVVKSAETDIKDSAKSQIKLQTLGITLHRWLEDNKPNDAALIKLRKGFIHRLTHDYAQLDTRALSDEDTIYFYRDYFENFKPLDLLNSFENEGYPKGLEDISKDENVRELIIRNIERYWPMFGVTTSSQYSIKSKDDQLIQGGRYFTASNVDDIMTYETLGHLCVRLPIFGNSIRCRFISNIALSWDDHSFKPGDILHHEQEFQFHMEYHLRYWEKDYRTTILQDGIILNRQHAKMPQVDGYEFHRIREARISFFLTIVPLSDAVTCTLLVFGDGATELDKPGKETWQEYKMDSCEKAIGIVQLQAMICTCCKHWEDCWRGILDRIDKTVRVKLDDTLKEEIWDRQMFDTSFRRSKHYFTVLQLLRIMAEWIEGSLDDQKRLRDQWRNGRDRLLLTLPVGELAIIDKNWDTIISSMELRTSYFLDRINRKTEEVKSLRDGLFNATSFREASKGMALNRAIHVFTVVTVIFTPAGFMATFWALPILNPQNDDSKPSPVALISTFIIIPLLTYMICLYAIGYFSLESSRRSFNSDTSQRLINAVFEPKRTVCRFLKWAGIDAVIRAINVRIYDVEVLFQTRESFVPSRKPPLLLRILKFLRWALAFYNDPSSGDHVR